MKASTMELVDIPGFAGKVVRQGFVDKALGTDTFQRSLGKGKCSAVWMVRLSVDVQTDTGIVWPSLVCSQHVVGSTHAAVVTDQRLLTLFIGIEGMTLATFHCTNCLNFHGTGMMPAAVQTLLADLEQSMPVCYNQESDAQQQQTVTDLA